MRKNSSLAFAATGVLLAAVLTLTGCKTTQMASLPGMGWLGGKKEKTPTPSEIAQSTPTPPPVATTDTLARSGSQPGSSNPGYQTGPYNTGGGVQQASTASSQPWAAQSQTPSAPGVQNGYYPDRGQAGTIQPNYQRTADLRGGANPGDPSYWGTQTQPTQPQVSTGQPIEPGYGPTVGTAPAGGYPTAQPQYPATQPQYPAAQSQYPVTQPQYPAAQSQYPATQPQYPATQPQYPAADGAMPAQPTAYPNNSNPASPGSYPTNNSAYPVNNSAYPVNDSAYPVNNSAYPVSPSASSQPAGGTNPPAEPMPPVNYRTAGALSQSGTGWRPGSTGNYPGYATSGAPAGAEVQTAAYNEPVSETR